MGQGSRKLPALTAPSRGSRQGGPASRGMVTPGRSSVTWNGSAPEAPWRGQRRRHTRLFLLTWRELSARWPTLSCFRVPRAFGSDTEDGAAVAKPAEEAGRPREEAAWTRGLRVCLELVRNSWKTALSCYRMFPDVCTFFETASTHLGKSGFSAFSPVVCSRLSPCYFLGFLNLETLKPGRKPTLP